MGRYFLDRQYELEAERIISTVCLRRLDPIYKVTMLYKKGQDTSWTDSTKDGPTQLKFRVTSNAFLVQVKLHFFYRCTICLPLSVI